MMGAIVASVATEEAGVIMLGGRMGRRRFGLAARACMDMVTLHHQPRIRHARKGGCDVVESMGYGCCGVQQGMLSQGWAHAKLGRGAAEHGLSFHVLD